MANPHGRDQTKDGLSKFRRQRRVRDDIDRPKLPPKLFPLDEEIIANLDAELDEHAESCYCDACWHLRAMKGEPC